MLCFYIESCRVPFCSKQTLFYVFFYALNSVGWLISVR
nr:MAG TPA: hypothetical protein [Caudoviricetes sp.]